MTYVATALVRSPTGWTAEEVDLTEYGDLDAVVDELRDRAESGSPVLLAVEEDDEWCGFVRVDGDGDPRLFLSDTRVLERSELAQMLFADASPHTAAVDDEDEEATARPEGDPGGDPGLLDDLGTPAATLLELCAEEGMLPADVIAAVCEKAGCAECLEELRGA